MNLKIPISVLLLNLSGFAFSQSKYNNYPKTLSIVETIKSKLNDRNPDMLTIAFKFNQDIINKLGEEKFPLVVLWPIDNFKFGLHSNMAFDKNSLRFFVKSHIFYGDIPEISTNTPINNPQNYKSFSGTYWKLESSFDKNTDLHRKTINGITIEGCYFIESHKSNNGKLGKICYIEKPIVKSYLN